MIALADATLEFWLTYGWRSMKFENGFAKYIGVKNAIFTNSGSSANLLSIACLCSPTLRDGLKAGVEVIAPATDFPTTVNPLILYGLKPVLVDSVVGTYNVDECQIEKTVSEKTRAIMLLGKNKIQRTIRTISLIDPIRVRSFCRKLKKLNLTRLNKPILLKT